MGQAARLEESRSDLHCNGSRISCLTEPLRQSSSRSHWGARWARRPRPNLKNQRREQWGSYRSFYPSGGSYSTSCSSLHRGSLHQIHEGVHGDDAGSGSGTSRATKTTPQGSDPRNLLEYVSHGMLPFLSAVLGPFRNLWLHRDELYPVCSRIPPWLYQHQVGST